MSRTSSSCLPVHLQTRECSSGRKVRCRRAPVGCRGQTRRGGLSLSWIIGMCARQHTQSNRLEMTLVSLGGTKCHHQCPLEFRKKDEVGCGRGGGLSLAPLVCDRNRPDLHRGGRSEIDRRRHRSVQVSLVKLRRSADPRTPLACETSS